MPPSSWSLQEQEQGSPASGGVCWTLPLAGQEEALVAGAVSSGAPQDLLQEDAVPASSVASGDTARQALQVHEQVAWPASLPRSILTPKSGLAGGEGPKSEVAEGPAAGQGRAGVLSQLCSWASCSCPSFCPKCVSGISSRYHCVPLNSSIRLGLGHLLPPPLPPQGGTALLSPWPRHVMCSCVGGRERQAGVPVGAEILTGPPPAPPKGVERH